MRIFGTSSTSTNAQGAPSNVNQQEECPRQGDLLRVMNNPASYTPSEVKNAHKLLKKWFRNSYNLWLEHNS